MIATDERPLPPLKPHVFLILMALADGQAHGYEIRSEVERRSDGAVRLDPGTLYRHISRLLADGLIEESDRRPPDDDPRRRYYVLTGAGVSAVAAEAARMEDLVDAVRASKLLRSRGETP